MTVSVVRCNLSDILQAIESQLIGTGCVGDASNIDWVIDGYEPMPGQTGLRDIMLLGRELTEKKGWATGGGRLARCVDGLVHVILRTTNVSDRAATKKDWIREHDAKRALIFDALDGRTPDDSGDWQSGNMLTVSGLWLERDAAMAQLPAKWKAWGDSLGAYRFEFMPALDPTVLA